MAIDASVFASTLGHRARHRGTSPARLVTARDLQFFLQVAHFNEWVTARVRSSATKVAESRVLIAKINDLLRG
jgi:hypothetical protein